MANLQGLVNEGATCYLNSLIQTLYMTNQFRTNVYAYLHDPKKISEKDSIPYQLQKLFVNLQTKNKPCFTKDLLKSFQWNDVDSFQQHDVQQFCRVLFEAIQKTHKNTTWIKELFGGMMNSYIDCGIHRSIRSQMFLDISLAIRNQYTKSTYNSLEECLQQFLRPQNMEGVQCSECADKVNVLKGLELSSIPPIFTIQLNRFQLNYQTFQRQKLNSFLYYPQILQLHRFVKPFDQIQIKGLPANLQIKTSTVAKEKSLRTADMFNVQPAAPKKRKTSDDFTNKKENVIFFDQENKNKRTKEEKDLSKEDQKQKNLQMLAKLKQDKDSIQKKVEKIKQKEIESIQNDMLFGMGPGAFKDWNAGSFEKPSEKPTYEKTQTKYQHDQQVFDPKKEYPNLTYALYAVLIHSGGSYGGHYYAYISDGFDWYKFDDSQVTKVSRFQMRKYGINNSSTMGTNAYMLFYRDVKTFKNLSSIEIPAQLLEKVKIQEEKVAEVTKIVNIEKAKRMQEIDKGLIVRVYKESGTEPIVITIEDKKIQNMLTVREKVKKQLNIVQKDENWRLRRYNKSDDSMHQIYGVELGNVSLQQLGFREQIHMIIECKSDAEIFQDYNPKKITVKVNLWTQNIGMIMEKKLKPIKIHILDQQPFEDLYAALVKATKIEKLLVIRRNFSGSNPITELNLQANKEKKLIDLRFFNNIVLYAQEQSQKGQIKWTKQFQNERFRCTIRFNNPKNGEAKDEQIYFDTRQTLGQLKSHLSELIGLPEDNFRIKRGKQALAEMTTYKKKLSDLRFVGIEALYIQQGKSSKGSIIVRRGEVSLVNDRIDFNLFEQLQFQLGNDLNNVGDLCNKISEQSGISAQNIRVREYRNYEFKQIFNKSDQIQRIREKSLIWQLIEGDLPKGLQIYYRVFNMMSFEFGPLKQVYADSSSSYEELALLIQQDSGMQADKILVWKPLSNYIEKENMLDCQWSQIRYLQRTIRDQPLMIGCDGDILILKEAEKAYKPRAVEKPKENTSKKGEAQLKITVISQNEITEEVPLTVQKKQQQSQKLTIQKQQKSQ